MEQKLTHFDERGRAVMVDVTARPETERAAVAKGTRSGTAPVAFGKQGVKPSRCKYNFREKEGEAP